MNHRSLAYPLYSTVDSTEMQTATMQQSSAFKPPTPEASRLVSNTPFILPTPQPSESQSSVLLSNQNQNPYFDNHQTYYNNSREPSLHLGGNGYMTSEEQRARNILLPHQLNSSNDEKQLDRIGNTLRYLDCNGITEQDFVDAIHRVFHFKSSEKVARNVFRHLDRNKDGKIKLTLAFNGVRRVYEYMRSLAVKVDNFVHRR